MIEKNLLKEYNELKKGVMMNMKIMVIVGISLLLFSSVAYGAGMARPLGMGGAFIAISDDVNGIFENPAGLCFGRGQELGVYYSGVNNEAAAGIGYRYTFGNSAALGVAVLRSVFSSFYYDLQDRYAYIAYSQKLSEGFSLGANLKGEVIRYSGISTNEGTGYSSDIGLLWEINKNFSLGVVVQNALKTTIKFTDDTEVEVDRYIEGGFSWRPGGDEGLILALDLSRVEGTFIYGFGVEGRPTDAIVLRGGASGATSELSKRSLFAGIGFNVSRGLYFDIAVGSSNSTGSFSWLF